MTSDSYAWALSLSSMWIGRATPPRLQGPTGSVGRAGQQEHGVPLDTVVGLRPGVRVSDGKPGGRAGVWV